MVMNRLHSQTHAFFLSMGSMQVSQKLTSYTSMERSRPVELGSQMGRFESAPIKSYEDSKFEN